MARNRIAANAGETELDRSLSGKTFLQPDGRIRHVSCIAPVHWDDQGQWVDIDDTPTSMDGGKTWSTPSTPYNLLWDSENLTLSLTSKRGGDVRVRLAALDGVAVQPQKDLPTVNGQSIRAFVAPELEIELRVRPNGVEIFKILHGPAAPRSFTWEVAEGDTTNIVADFLGTKGRDNLGGTQARKLGNVLNRHRSVEITHVKSNIDLLPGKAIYSVIESFTGRTRLIDPDTRARTWVDEVEWPVEIDVTVTVLVTADQDDGRGNSTTWYITGPVVRSTAAAAFRFQTVNVPQGQVLDSATLTINVTNRGGTESATLAGNNVDSAAAWAGYSANTPLSMSATTANVSWQIPATTGLKNIDVKAICQEIINRAGWAANNNLRLGFTNISGITTSYAYIEDYSDPGTAQAQLVIVYTAGGSAGNIAWIKA